MVGVFRRSLSTPSNPPKPSPTSLHTRSISLPSTSHPFTSILNHSLSILKSPSYSSEQALKPSSHVLARMTLLESTLGALCDVILLPQSQLSLRNSPVLVESLLEDFLRLVDLYGILRMRISSLRDSNLAARTALRRKDTGRLGFYVKYSKKFGKELMKLATNLSNIGRYTKGDGELEGAASEVVEATVLVTSELLERFSASLVGRKRRLSLWKKARKGNDGEGIEKVKTVVVGVEELMTKDNSKEEPVREVMKKMEEMEEWLGKIESVCERVFRSLINARASLLNALPL